MKDLYVVMEEALRSCIEDIRRRSEQAGQVVTGKTLRALEVRMRIEGGNIIGEIWGRPYTGALETGSSPARKASQNPKLTQKIMAANLAQWMRIRGLATGMNDKQLKLAAEHLAWYIRRYGTELYRKGGRRDIITPGIEATVKTLTDRLGIYYEQLVIGAIDNNFFREPIKMTTNHAN